MKKILILIMFWSAILFPITMLFQVYNICSDVKCLIFHLLMALLIIYNSIIMCKHCNGNGYTEHGGDLYGSEYCDCNECEGKGYVTIFKLIKKILGGELIL